MRPHGIALRHMAHAELQRIGEIDRSEHITAQYTYRDGRLEKRAVDLHARCSLAESVPSWRQILERGGTLVGAFDAAALAGIAIYRPNLAEGLADLAVLHVSRSHRGKGVGALLTREVARLARADGATRLYVSATPTAATVDFYRGRGFQPTDEPHPELLALEPDDIHMTLEL